MSWRPLSVRLDNALVSGYDALHEGVPEWMRASVVRWVQRVLLEVPYGLTVEDVLLRLEQQLRLTLSWGDGIKSASRSLLAVLDNDDTPALDIIDGCLAISKHWPYSQNRNSVLSDILSLSGSAWTLGETANQTPCLHRRVNPTVQTSAILEMDQKSRSAQHLKLAWHAIYGRAPDASTAFREAVRAVEAVCQPTICPKDDSATLGTMISAMRDKPSKWTYVLGDVNNVLAMMSQIWKSQFDRHGTNDESIPLHVSIAEAEAAVHVAVTLVHLFRTEAITVTNPATQ